MTLTEPYALIVEWANSVIATTSPGTIVTTQVDPDRGLPQILVSQAGVLIGNHADGRVDGHVVRVGFTISAVAAGGPQPNFQQAHALLAGLIAQLPGTVGVPNWTSAAGETLINTTSSVVTRATSPDDTTARYTLSAAFTVMLPVAP